MRQHIALPAVLYLALLDRLGDCWNDGRHSHLFAHTDLEDTLALATDLSTRLVLPRAAIRLSRTR